mmetsp:Transcript_64046/g.152745  ORF Transcript_64046/g.152745 Transcript_64046/m.152745 type:complete len:296 (+) Transcript_64046:283-1170(+)
MAIDVVRAAVRLRKPVVPAERPVLMLAEVRKPRTVVIAVDEGPETEAGLPKVGEHLIAPNSGGWDLNGICLALHDLHEALDCQVEGPRLAIGIVLIGLRGIALGEIGDVCVAPLFEALPQGHLSIRYVCLVALHHANAIRALRWIKHMHLLLLPVQDVAYEVCSMAQSCWISGREEVVAIIIASLFSKCHLLDVFQQIVKTILQLVCLAETDDLQFLLDRSCRQVREGLLEGHLENLFAVVTLAKRGHHREHAPPKEFLECVRGCEEDVGIRTRHRGAFTLVHFVKMMILLCKVC